MLQPFMCAIYILSTGIQYLLLAVVSAWVMRTHQFHFGSNSSYNLFSLPWFSQKLQEWFLIYPLLLPPKLFQFCSNTILREGFVLKTSEHWFHLTASHGDKCTAPQQKWFMMILADCTRPNSTMFQPSVLQRKAGFWWGVTQNTIFTQENSKLLSPSAGVI